MQLLDIHCIRIYKHTPSSPSSETKQKQKEEEIRDGSILITMTMTIGRRGTVMFNEQKKERELVLSGVTVRQISKGAHQWSIDVSGGFRVGVVIALIGELVIVVGASHDSTDESVWVGSVAV